MKKLKIIITISVLVFSFACSDYLDVVPDNVATIDHAFLDRTSAERYLATCYTYFPELSDPAGDPAILGSDEWWAIEDDYYNSRNQSYAGLKIKKGEQNSNSPLFNFWDGYNGGKACYRAIRDCNVFLENIRKVGGDLSEEEAARWTAEVKVLKAYYHFYMMRMYGPIPIVKENLPISSNIDEVRVYRDPFDEGIDYIVSLLDEAVPDLPLEILNVSAEDGRITKPIALALKAEILVTAASPLFNGNSDLDRLVDNRGVQLVNTTYDVSKWSRAATACKNAIDTCLLAGHQLYEFTKQTNLSDSTKLLMTLRHVVTDRWNKEIIWTEAKLSMYNYQRATTPLFFIEQFQWMPTDPYMCPTLRMAELFYTKNGVPIEEDTGFDYPNRFNTTAAPDEAKYYIQPGYETAKLNINREARFYANLAFDGAIWFGNGRYKDVGDGAANEQPWVFQTKKGQAQGKTSNIRYSLSGYWAKRTSHFESVSTSSSSNVIVRSTFPVIRLADLYLLYAEALNESMEIPNQDVYEYIDKVRERAGLNGVMESWQNASRYPSKPSTKEGMREIIQQERMIELAFEGKRFWDIRRWKTAHEWLNQPIRGLNPAGETAQELNSVRVLYTPEFSTKDYLFPIRQYNLRVNTNLIQNPYW
ncbi:RagB/SusD family nutrient uptake outer membrane protein [Maribellus sp. YY47]|uniref:RagB/SusD family nutrient uptake outer membrane protein n=1 Tax=Maribellus sp. YY47 TaxID=2929486 RepID=UPI0020013FC7|nr:RagB/SusD family nutrient uptake outer membrane protein [Maribellus sp. YY47]MCK3683904.1 RagB/SusD family nutrient uptake outer membrane protein [Maribellus sp. YY47]